MGCNRAPIDRLVACEDPEDRMKADIDEAMKSALGSAMFGSSLAADSIADYSQDLKKLLDPLEKQDTEVSEAQVAEFYKDAHVLRQKHASSDSECRIKRKIDLKIYKKDITVDVLVLFEYKVLYCLK